MRDGRILMLRDNQLVFMIKSGNGVSRHQIKRSLNCVEKKPMFQINTRTLLPDTYHLRVFVQNTPESLFFKV